LTILIGPSTSIQAASKHGIYEASFSFISTTSGSPSYIFRAGFCYGWRLQISTESLGRDEHSMTLSIGEPWPSSPAQKNTKVENS
jgi:hypothetical protein